MLLPAGRLVLRILAGAAAALGILIAAAGWRLAQGPVSLAVLTPYLADALSYAEAGISAELEDTIVTWAGWERALEIRAVGLELHAPDGRLIASAPEVALGLSAPALLRGRLVPTAIDIVGPVLRLRRGAEGQLDFGLGETAEADAGSGEDRLARLLHELSQPRDASKRLGLLSRASVLGAEILLDDLPTGTSWRATRSDLVLQREPGAVRADLVLNLALGEETARISAQARYDGEAGSIAVRAALAQLQLAALAQGVLARLEGVRVPVSGTLALTIGADRSIGEIAFDLAAGSGEVALPDLYAEPVKLTGATLRGTVNAAGDSVRIEQARLALGGASIAAQGTVAIAPALGAMLEGELRALPVEALKHYWPATAAPNARQWIAENLHGGQVEQGRFALRLSPEAIAEGAISDDDVRLDFTFSGIAADYLRPLPRLTDARGTGRLTGHRFTMAVPSARVGALAVSAGAIAIDGLQEKDQNAAIELTVDGPLAEALALLDRPPLQLVSKIGMRPGSVGGSASTRARFAFPLEQNLKIEQVAIGAVSEIRDGSLPGILDRFALTQAQMRVKVDDKGLDATGRGALNGVPLDIAWRQEFESRQAVTARYRIGGSLDDAARRALGLPLDPWLSGPIGGELAIDELRGGSARLNGRFGLAGASLRLPEIHWSKPAEAPGEAVFALTVEAGRRIRIDNASLTAADLQARDSGLVIGEQLQRLDLPSLAYGENRLRADVRRADSGYRAEIRAERLDLRPWLDDAFRAGSAGAGPTLEVGIAAASARLADTVTLANLTAQIGTDRGKLRRVSATGDYADGGTLALDIAPDSAGRSLTLKSDNAAATLRVLDIGHIAGGRLDVAARMADGEPGSPIRGDLRMEEFRVVDAPLLARLLTLGSLTGIGQTLRGDGIGFVRADVPFTLTETAIAIRKARAHGPAIGLSAEGTVQRKDDTIDLTGTVVPAYTINRILGSIPVLGPLVVGEGILGMNFRVSGPIGDPQASVNPLSALAPGFLRQLFQAPDPQASTPPPAPGEQSKLP